MAARSEPFADYFHKAANVKFTENVCFKCFIIIIFFLSFSLFFIMFCFLFAVRHCGVAFYGKVFQGTKHQCQTANKKELK